MFRSTRARRAVWWVIATVAAGVLAFLAMRGSGDRKALAPKNRSEEKAVVLRDEWGPESGGVRCRLIAVSAASNDEAPDGAVTTDSFPNGDDVTFAVDLKNVSSKPFTLLGVRYGESYGGASGKLATELIAPYLFTWEFTDPTGQPIPRPERVLVGGLALMGASAHEIAPGKSLRVLLRPARFSSSMEYLLPPGDTRARVRYCSSGRGKLAERTETQPDMPQAVEWSGEVVSNQVAFTVGGAPGTPKPGDLRWGTAKGGLRAAVRFETDSAGVVPINSWVDVVLHVENVSDQPISLVSETLRQDDKVTVKSAAGIENEVGGPWYTGWPTTVCWTLRPGEVAELGTMGLTVAADDEAVKKLKGLAGKIFKTRPGTYSFRYTIRLDQGNWQGELATGDAPLIIRARTTEDDARDRGETFVGRIEFFGKDGKAIDRGLFTARPETD